MAKFDIKELYSRIITSLVLLPILLFCIFFNKNIFILFLLMIGLISSYEWYNMHKKKSVLLLFSGLIFLYVSIFSAYALRGDNYQSMFFFTWILLICFFSDIGGYTCGKIIGGKKISKISPNKTLSGVLGSISFSFLPIFIISYQHLFDIKLFVNFNTLFISCLVSLISQTGDMFISYFKRLRKIKDTGNILPGHGGILDRIDGIIFVLPFIFFSKLVELV